MKDIFIIREGDLDSEIEPASVGDEKIYLHKVKPEFFRWKGSHFENIFVGVCTIYVNDQRIVVYSLPKYFFLPEEKRKVINLNEINSNKIKLDEIKRVLKQICLVAEKLKKEYSNSEIFADTDKFFEPYELKSENQKVNQIELAEYLIDDYIQNGLYVKDILRTKKNGLGRTNWAKTVLKITPVIQDGNVVYLDRINREHNIDENDLIRNIHAKVISQCLDLVGPLMSDGIVMMEDGIEDIGEDLECYAQEISNQSSYVFGEREINLFKALEAWCRNTKYYKSYIGVTHFELLWEWVNDSVWGNISSKKSDNPKYHFIGHDDWFSGTGSAIPDTVRVETEDNKVSNKKRIYVFDSKYYVLKELSAKAGVIGWPANSDIAKQIEYLESLKYLLKKVNREEKVQIDYKNAFLLPECTPESIPESMRDKFVLDRNVWYKKIGYVEQGMFNELLKAIMGAGTELDTVEARTVDLIIVKSEVLYDYYLNKKKVSAEELLSIWDGDTCNCSHEVSWH